MDSKGSRAMCRHKSTVRAARSPREIAGFVKRFEYRGWRWLLVWSQLVRSLTLLLLVACGANQHPAAPPPSAIDGIFIAFADHPVVAIAERHRSVACHELLQALI